MSTIEINDLSEASRAVRLRWALSDGAAVARRNLTHVRHVPEKLIDVTIQPLMFVLLFAYVFGGAIHVAGGNYKTFLMAGIFIQTVAFGSASSAVSIADDVANGVVDRFRSLPMARSAVLVGRTFADLVASLLGTAIMASAGLVVGWRIHAGVGDAVAGFALLIAFGYAMQWVGTLIGLLVRAPDAAQGIAFTTLFPLTFLANTFVPLSSLPRGLRDVANWNPISALVAALRQLWGNTGGAPTPSGPLPLAHPVAASMVWIAVILAVTLPLAIRRYKATTAQ